ncbi:MAG: pantetheine-phosphate adenylyltransferase [Bdellovibrionota bacterium]|jgi:pantetheine-phosphate adenylyltransferase
MTQEKLAVFPGSFDPLTNGHVDLVERALSIFDRVIVAIVAQTQKSNELFSLEERLEMIREHFSTYGGKVQVEPFSGLLVNFVRQSKAQVIIRGLRAISDFDYEAQMALMNRHLGDGIETVFLMAREEYSYINSTLVRQIAPLGGDITKIVPRVIEKAVMKKFGIS